MRPATRKALAIILSTSVLVGYGYLRDDPAVAQVGGDDSIFLFPSDLMGDVNGDCSTDISDAVHLLNFLFGGGEAPIACAQVETLTTEQVDLLRDLSEHLSVVDLDDGAGNSRRTIRFSGVNVQIVNGLGSTLGGPPGGNQIVTNGLGNLLVGYNESRVPRIEQFRDSDDPTTQAIIDVLDREGEAVDKRGGSHNIVVGGNNNYTSVASVAVGQLNTVSSAGFASGLANLALGTWSTASGGAGNIARGASSATTGGFVNEANGSASSVSGGARNTASGLSATVCGGYENTAFGPRATVSGGHAVSAECEDCCASCP